MKLKTIKGRQAVWEPSQKRIKDKGSGLLLELIEFSKNNIIYIYLKNSSGIKKSELLKQYHDEWKPKINE